MPNRSRAYTEDMDRNFLGVGWKFPIQVTPDGAIARAAYEDRVEESVYLILSTALGERLMLPDFGSSIHELVFAPNNEATISSVTQRVRSALVNHEPRIEVHDVNVETAPETPNLLLIRINYRIRSSNTQTNLVYPFYLSEA